MGMGPHLTRRSTTNVRRNRYVQLRPKPSKLTSQGLSGVPAQEGTLSRGCAPASALTRTTIAHARNSGCTSPKPQNSFPLPTLLTPPQGPQSCFWIFPGKRLETCISPCSCPWGTACVPSTLHVTPRPLSQRPGARLSCTAHGAGAPGLQRGSLRQGEGCPEAHVPPKDSVKMGSAWAGNSSPVTPAAEPLVRASVLSGDGSAPVGPARGGL